MAHVPHDPARITDVLLGPAPSQVCFLVDGGSLMRAVIGDFDRLMIAPHSPPKTSLPGMKGCSTSSIGLGIVLNILSGVEDRIAVPRNPGGRMGALPRGGAHDDLVTRDVPVCGFNSGGAVEFEPCPTESQCRSRAPGPYGA
jgi:hypothetical protein